MRPAFFMLFLLLLGIAAPAAQAQTASPAKALLGPSAKPAPEGSAAPAAPAIIPGSPLAALAKATAAAPAAPSAEENVPAPFGTRQIGFVITTAIGADTVRALRQFAVSVHDATRLAPVTDWLGRMRASSFGRAETKSIVKALLVVTLPAALVDAALRFVLRRPAARCAQWALPRQGEELPAAAGPAGAVHDDTGDEPDDTQGLADAEAGALERPVRRHPFLRGWGRRLSFALLNLILSLVPVAGFILTALLLLTSGIATHRAGALAATGVGNAYFVCRIVQELARFLINPGAPSLRLIAMPSGRAQAFMNWLLIVLATIFFGASLVSCALVLGLPHSDAQVLTRFVALAVHLEAAVGIWRCRRLVAGWIAGAQPGKGGFGWLRRHLGRSWHFIALFYILALWLAWTAGVQNAFIVLLRSVLVLITALVVGAAAWKASAALLDRLLAAPAGGTARHPNLQARIRVYGPLLSFLLRAAIAGTVLLLILQGWGFDTLDWLRHNTISQALLSALTSVLTTTLVALCLWEGVNFTLRARIDRLAATGRKRQASRLRTLAPILRGAIGALIFVVALLVCLAKIGVNTTGLLAISSVAGVAVAFGSQTLVRDIITGLFLLLEDALQVGDAVTLAGMSGTVEKLSIRTIYLRGGDGSVNIIPFSSVTIITNATRDFNNAELAITVGYGENIDHVCALLTDIGRDMRAETLWGAMIRDDLQIFGLDKFAERGMVITAQIRTAPGQNAAVRREFYRRVQQRFNAEGIAIPVQQSVFKLEMPNPETR
jgi:small conductance mechanosensitive channel